MMSKLCPLLVLRLILLRYAHGVRFGMWKHNHTMTRGKLAADLSQYQHLERVAKENKPAIIVEDDANFVQTEDWYGALLQVLRELPQVRSEQSPRGRWPSTIE